MIEMKRFLLLIILFNSLFYTVSGNISDSLENRLNRATSDTAKVMIYNRIAQDIMTGQSQTYFQTLQYALQGGRIQEYRLTLQYAQQGLALAEQIQFDKGRAELHRTMGNAYFRLSEFDQAIEQYENALGIYETIKDKNGMARMYFNIALVYHTQESKIYDMLDMVQKALLIWKQLNNTTDIFRAYEFIIRVYRNMEEWQHAESYAYESINIALNTGNRNEEALMYEFLGQIKNSKGDLKAAEEYYQKSLHIYEELNDQMRTARMLLFFADNIYVNNPDTAIVLMRKSAAIYEQASSSHVRLFDVYNGIANLYQKKNQIDSVKYYKEKSLNKAILSGNAQIMAIAYNSTAKYHLMKGEIALAEKEYNFAYDIAFKSGLYGEQSKALMGLDSISYRKGNYRAAYEYVKRNQFIRDSLSIEENTKNVKRLTMQFEFERDMIERNESIKAQLEGQQQAIKYNENIMTIISIALMCAIILLGFIIRSNRRNQLANVKLEQQHHEILHINDELQQSHQELSKYKDSLEEMVREQMEELQQSEIRLRTLSDNLPGGCIYQKNVYQDGKESISYISNTAEEWLGLSAELIMSDINRFYRQMAPEDLKKKRQLEQESILSMTSHSCEYRLKKDDQELWLLENAVPRVYTNRNIVWDGIIVNITDRKKFEKELIEAKEHAEESDRLKSAFLANMSHEIRTPMNGIVGFLGFVERDDLPAQKRHVYISIIRNNIQQLLQLVGDIIDISKIESNQLTLYQVSFDLNVLMKTVETYFQEYIATNHKNMTLILDDSHFISPCIIKSDPVRIRQVLTNLIGNAIKFTEKGYIRFGYNLSEDRNKLYFFVEDTGIGIPESKHNCIFERFRQAHDDNKRIIYGGTGIGLSISKSIVEIMGGEIGVESEEGVGSTFYFMLPYFPDNSDE